MEKFHLPILLHQENPFAQKPERREKELPVEFKIAKAFLYQKYPLTEKGRQIQQKVQEILSKLKQDSSNTEALDGLRELKLHLPTVENPHLDYFEDLHVSPKEERELFGIELANVQITKGCRHQCGHCAAAADKKVEIMPFPAILKIAQKMHQQEGVVEKAYQDYRDVMLRLFKDEEFRAFLAEIIKGWGNREIINGREIDDAERFFWYINDGFGYLKTEDREKFAKFLDKVNTKPEVKHFFEVINLPRHLKNLPKHFHFGEIFNLKKTGPLKLVEIENYYDSDPFDYRDTAFLHEDGLPADYGDVVKAIASQRRKVHITTAGWPLSDKIAQRGAEKLSSSSAHLLATPRISVHPYEKGTSHGDASKYRESMERVLKTLAPTKPEILFFKEPLTDSPEELEKVEKFKKEALDPLYKLCKELDLPIKGTRLSRYSGRAESADKKEKEHDVMSCMPGTHILPDGSIHKQSLYVYYEDYGQRPEPSGKKIY